MSMDCTEGMLSSLKTKGLMLAFAALAILLMASILVPTADATEEGYDDLLDSDGRIDRDFVERNNLIHGIDGDIYWVYYDSTLWLDGEGTDKAKTPYTDREASIDPDWEDPFEWKFQIDKLALTKAVVCLGDESFYNSVIDFVDFTRCENLVIEDEAFKKSSMLILDVPESVASIGSEAFCYCYQLYKVYFDGYCDVAEDAFYVAEDIYEPPDTMYIYSPFNYLEGKLDCPYAHYVYIPSAGLESGLHYWHLKNHILYIETSTTPDIRNYSPDDRPEWCGLFTGPTSFGIEIDDTFETIGSYVFFDTGYISYIKVGNGVKTIGDHAFANNRDGRSIILGDSVETIGDYAFAFSTMLESINIPASVKYIGKSAFEGCSSLTELRLTGDVVLHPEALVNSGFVSIDLSEANITNITPEMFKGCNRLQNVILPHDVEEIGDRAFAGCASLQSVEFPQSLVKIGSGAFEGCTSLKSIMVPAFVIDIGDRAFANCSFHSLYFQGSPESLGNEAFYGCGGLKYIRCESNIPMRNIGASAFCLNLDADEVQFCTVTSEGNSAKGIFDDYRGKNPDATIFNYVPTVSYDGNIQWEVGETVIRFSKIASAPNGDMNDYDRNDLPRWMMDGSLFWIDKIVIGHDISKIGSFAFYDLDIQIEIENYRTLKSIGDSAFEGCGGFDSMDMPYAVLDSIGDRAFAGCFNIRSISIPTSVSTIGEQAFAGCSNVSGIWMYGDSWDFKHIGERAFDLGEDVHSIMYSEHNIAQTYMPNGSGSTHFLYLPFHPSQFEDGDKGNGSDDSDTLIKGISTFAVLAVTAIFIAVVARKD